MALVALVLLVALPVDPAYACRDSGMPISGPTEPFDAGPDCDVLRNTCGTYSAVCRPPDAGPPPAPRCSLERDSGMDESVACVTSADCPGSDTVCGSAGFCECAERAGGEAPTGGCSIARGPTSSAAWFALLALVLAARRRTA